MNFGMSRIDLFTSRVNRRAPQKVTTTFETRGISRAVRLRPNHYCTLHIAERCATMASAGRPRAWRAASTPAPAPIAPCHSPRRPCRPPSRHNSLWRPVVQPSKQAPLFFQRVYRRVMVPPPPPSSSVCLSSKPLRPSSVRPESVRQSSDNETFGVCFSIAP